MARFVALGDSLTEGVGDPHPAWPNGLRGWADLVAARLAALDATSDYANLALRGKTARDVAAEQLPTALELRPDVVTVWAGGNDILRPVMRLDDVLAPLDEVLAHLAAVATVVVFTGFEVSGSPVLRPVRARVRALNAGLREMAAHHGAVVADVSGRQTWQDTRLWAADRVHPSALGHLRLASEVSQLLGLAASSEPPPLDPVPRRRPARLLADEVEWWRVHAAPHIARWATRASRREHVAPKWAVPVRPAESLPWTGSDHVSPACSANPR
ncbi:lysophospholipase L1-like esterase [Knoellia remsis]|uniref:Lysophospholipase L1-like esterase n=1 Tax=Knoellia remsis TaxID=407159 RepID=A0A2T0UKA4_9MICO|nr:SGNH/GDSL hydrolase family protein [Knoellia remsis]PRY58257.1 lysophospholipase L1-like esterase [Knoellia remsis]